MCFDMHQSDKLSVFVDDARRYPVERAEGSGVEVLPPDVNYSQAKYTTEQTDHGYAVRYALAGIRNVGEKAMEAIVAEREANGKFESLKDFFERIPQGSMNRRQLEGLICAGALDGLHPNRGELFANADLLLATAEAAARERSSGQGGLFGGDNAPQDDLRLQASEPWPRIEQMAKERENFGFYFSAHPVQQYREAASAHGARTYQSLMEGGAPAGGRSTAMIAAMVEGASKGRTKRGADFIRADFSDSSGQFSSACFEESLVEKFPEWAASGECVLLTVELDSPNPGEPPRLTVRGARPLSAVSGSIPMILRADVHSPDAIAQLKLELATTPEAQGEVILRLVLDADEEAHVRLGSQFVLSGDLAERLAEMEGLANVTLTPARGRANLKLVA